MLNKNISAHVAFSNASSFDFVNVEKFDVRVNCIHDVTKLVDDVDIIWKD